jgi:hypothetical protein
VIVPDVLHDAYPEDEQQSKFATRLWKYTAHMLKRELWDTSYFRGQHPHLWAEVLDTSVPDGPEDAIANRKFEVDAVETHCSIIRELKNAPAEWKVLQDIHWWRYQVNAEIVCICRSEEVNWNPRHDRLVNWLSWMWMNYGNVKYVLDDKFGGAKKLAKVEKKGGPGGGKFYEQVCLLEHIRMHPDCDAEKGAPMLRLY